MRCEPTLQRLCASVYRTSAKSFARCEPPKAFYRVRVPRALRGASLQRLSTVYERQELCAVRASNGFVPLCAVRASRALCGASLQRPSTVYERQELCAVRASNGFVPLCAVRASRAFCALRAYTGFLPCAGARPSRFVMCSCTRTCTYVLSVRAHTIFVFTWIQTHAVKNYIIGTDCS